MFSLTKAGIESSDIKMIVSMFFIGFLLVCLISLALRILNALGVYEMTKTLGIKSKWFAFFPFFSSVAVGKLADCSRGMATTFFRKILLILDLIHGVILSLGIYLLLICSIDTVFAADKVLYKNKEITTEVASPLILPAVIICMSILVFFIYKVFYYIALWRIFRAFAPSSAILYFIISIFISFTAPVFIFLIRKNKPFFPRKNLIGYNNDGQQD